MDFCPEDAAEIAFEVAAELNCVFEVAAEFACEVSPLGVLGSIRGDSFGCVLSRAAEFAFDDSAEVVCGVACCGCGLAPLAGSSVEESVASIRGVGVVWVTGGLELSAFELVGDDGGLSCFGGIVQRDTPPLALLTVPLKVS
jgi:hypothetical protein